MATFTLTSDRFPNGTSVSVYAARVHPKPGAPTGSLVTSATVSGGSVTFTGLTDDTFYEAYASVDGQHRYVKFSTHDDVPAAQQVSAGSSSQPFGVFLPEDYGAEGDVVTVTDASIGSGQAVLSTPSYVFIGADVGKLVAVDGALAASSTNPLGTLLTTIASVGGGNATLAASATQTVAGREASWGTDDTAALNTTLAAAQAAFGKVSLGARTYGFKASDLSPITGSCSIAGAGVFGVYGTFASGVGNFTPGLAPWLRGSVLKCFTAGQAQAISITGESQNVDARDFGIVFAQKWGSTGHGIRANPGSNKNGLGSPDWRNVQVFGHDGNSYAFDFVNMAMGDLWHLRGWGGGVLRILDDAGSQYGNSTIYGLNGKLFVGGSAHYCHLNPWTRVGLVGCEFNAHNLKVAYASRPAFAGIWSVPTSAQKLLLTGSSLRGLSIVSPSFDVGSSAVGAPSLAAAPTDGGVFVDPGGFYSIGSPPQDNGLPMIAGATGSGGGVMPHGQHVVATHTASATIPSTSVYNLRFGNATSGAITLTLPAASATKGRRYTFKKTDSSGNAVTIQRAGTDTIDGATTKVLAAQYDMVTILSDGTVWHIVG